MGSYQCEAWVLDEEGSISNQCCLVIASTCGHYEVVAAWPTLLCTTSANRPISLDLAVWDRCTSFEGSTPTGTHGSYHQHEGRQATLN